MEYVIKMLDDKLFSLNYNYEEFIVLGKVDEDSNMAIENRKNAKELITALKILKEVETSEKAVLSISDVKTSTLPEPQQWFMEKFDVTASRMNLIEHKGNDVVRFIHEYLDDLP